MKSVLVCFGVEASGLGALRPGAGDAFLESAGLLASDAAVEASSSLPKWILGYDTLRECA